MNIQPSFYRSVNGIERAPRSNLARLPAISSFWTLFVGILRYRKKVMHWCSMRAIQLLLYMYSNTYICYFFRQFHSYISGNWKSRERETGRERERETKICAKLPGQRRLVALGYCLHESQGRGLRTHSSLTLFMSKTRKNCGGEATTINSIIVSVKYPFSSHYSQDCTLHAARDLLNPFLPLMGAKTE